MEPTGFARKHRAQIIMEKLGQCDGIIKTCISICPDSRLAKALDELQENVVNVVAKAEMLSNGDEQIQSSKKLIKSSKTNELYERILKFYSGDARVREAQSFEDIADYMFGLGLDEQYSDNEIYDASRWVYDDICNNEITNSRKPIKSFVDTSDEYFEDFEDEDAYMKDLDERLRAQYADENGLDLNEDVIDENDYNEWVHRGAAMYSSVDRNRMNVKALYK